jgi:hypothetical protein
MVEKEVWVKVGQTGTAPIITTYRGPRGLKLVVSVAYYKKQNGNIRPGWFGPGVELYSARGKLLATGPEAVKAYLTARGVEYPLMD